MLASPMFSCRAIWVLVMPPLLPGEVQPIKVSDLCISFGDAFSLPFQHNFPFELGDTAQDS